MWISCGNLHITVSPSELLVVRAHPPKFDLKKAMVGELPKTTKEKITLIAKGGLYSEKTSQLLNGTFDAEDYLEVLPNYPDVQQYIDGLYEVTLLLFCDRSFR